MLVLLVARLTVQPSFLSLLTSSPTCREGGLLRSRTIQSGSVFFLPVVVTDDTFLSFLSEFPFRNIVSPEHTPFTASDAFLLNSSSALQVPAMEADLMSAHGLDYRALLEKAESGELDELAAVYYQLGSLSSNPNRAISYYKRSIDINLHYRPSNHDLLSSSYSNVGTLLAKSAYYDQAIKYYQRAVNIDLRDPALNQLRIANHYTSIGNALKGQHHYEAACEFFHRALDIRRKNLPPTDLLVVATLENLGSTFRSMREYAAANDHYERALEILERAHPRERQRLSRTYNKIGSVYCLMNNYRAALTCQEKALEHLRECVGPDHPSLAVRHFNLAVAFDALNRVTESIGHATRAVEVLQRSNGSHQRKLRRYQHYLDELGRKQ